MSSINSIEFVLFIENLLTVIPDVEVSLKEKLNNLKKDYLTFDFSNTENDANKTLESFWSQLNTISNSLPGTVNNRLNEEWHVDYFDILLKTISRDAIIVLFCTEELRNKLHT